MKYQSKPLPTKTAVQAALAFQAPPEHLMPADAAGRGTPTGNLDLGLVDTTPGEGGAMSPPAGTDLTAVQYQDLMRKRYRDDHGHRQHMALYAKRHAPCTGPFADQARTILTAIRESHVDNDGK